MRLHELVHARRMVWRSDWWLQLGDIGQRLSQWHRPGSWSETRRSCCRGAGHDHHAAYERRDCHRSGRDCRAFRVPVLGWSEDDSVPG